MCYNVCVIFNVNSIHQATKSIVAKIEIEEGPSLILIEQ